MQHYEDKNEYKLTSDPHQLVEKELKMFDFSVHDNTKAARLTTKQS